MAHKAIDLFAGPGGLSLGLKEAGFSIIAAIERDADAGLTYRHNVGTHTYTRDITEFGPVSLREDLEKRGALEPGERLSLIAGGPPCPGFSLIGRSKIMDLIKKGEGEYADRKEFEHRFIDDPRNRLFVEFVKYVEEFEPDYFIMENVSGMLSYSLDGDPVIDVIKERFGEGYNVDHHLLLASKYGVPQDRRRIIFLGSRKEMPVCKRPESVGDRPSAEEAIRDLWDTPPNYVDGCVRVRDEHRGNPGRNFRSHMRKWECEREDGTKVASMTGRKTCHWTRKVNARDKVIFPFIKSAEDGERQIYGDIYPGKWSTLSESFEEAGLAVSEEGGRHYVVDPNSGKKWVMYTNRVFKDKMRRIERDDPSPTVVAHLAKDGYMFIHPVHDRTITVREAARFQSFPDAFEFKGSMTSQFRQVGNAVPPLLALELGREVIRALDRKTDSADPYSQTDEFEKLGKRSPGGEDGSLQEPIFPLNL